MRRRPPLLLLSTALVAGALPLLSVPPALAADLDPSADAVDLGRALASDPGVVVGARFTTRPPAGRPSAVSTTPLAGFPTSGGSYAVLSSGDATLAPAPNVSGSSTAGNGSGPRRSGDSDRDAVVLAVDIDVPDSANCLVGLDFRFLSEEFPEFVGSSFNDAFVAELDRTTWTVRGSDISAPDNFAFDPTGSPVTINAAGATSMTAGDAAGTTYDGATPLLTAATPVTPGRHTLYLSVFDAGDSAYDSTVLVDALRFDRVADLDRDCRPGAKPALRRAQAKPLLGAHGITGVPADMSYALRLADALVPTLSAARSAATPRITSVWHNGAIIQREAREITASTGSRTANVIAHSKGGLDSRVALWRSPRLFSGLGMLATPNGGSKGANKICAARRIGSNIQSAFGPCDGPEDGVYNLQTGYMRDVFNPEVRDHSQHSLSVAAGDCTGAIPTSLASAKCNASHRHLLDCPSKGSDSAVCVRSAFERSRLDGRGKHFALDPVFRGDHTFMRSAPCPVSRVVTVLYGTQTRNSPWNGDNGRGCEDLDPTPSGAVSFKTSSAPPAEEAPVTGADGVPLPQLSPQRLVALEAGPAAPAVLTVDPEGGDVAVVELLLAADADPTVTVTRPDGTPDRTVTTTSSELFGGQVLTVQLSGLGGEARRLSLRTAAAQPVAAQVLVLPSGLSLAPTVTAVAPGRGRVDVVVRGLSLPHQRDSRLVATVPTASGPLAVRLAPTGPATGADHLRTWSGTVPLQPGEWNPVDVVLDGPRTRTVTESTVTADGSGRLLGLAGDRLVDTDADGTADSLQVDVRVDVDLPGTYHVAVDLAGPQGLLSAPGTAVLAPGAGVVPVLAPVASLVEAGGGAFTVRDVLLTRGTDTRTRVATAAELGRTASYPLAALPVDGVRLTTPALVPADADGDGRLDRVEVRSRASAPVAGAYRLSASLLGPDGETLDVRSQDLLLPAGVSDVRLDHDGSGVADRGPGQYSVLDLTLTPTDETVEPATAPPGLLVVADVAGWAGATPDSGTLVSRWKAAGAAGEISSRGLYTSELERLERVAAADDAGDDARAVAELDRFVEHLEQERSAGLTTDAAARLTSYAREVRAVLAG